MKDLNDFTQQITIARHLTILVKPKNETISLQLRKSFSLNQLATIRVAQILNEAAPYLTETDNRLLKDVALENGYFDSIHLVDFQRLYETL